MDEAKERGREAGGKAQGGEVFLFLFLLRMGSWVMIRVAGWAC